MAEEPLAFDYSKLSPRDQEILRAFQATNEFETRPPDDNEPVAPPIPQPVDPTLDLEDEMIAVFATEVEGDLAVLRAGLEQAERDEDVNSPGFLTLQHIAHKIRGSAGMIGCDAMSTVAHRIELVVHQIMMGKTDAHTGLYGLAQAVGALEMTLASVVTEKQEDLQPLLGLEQDFVTLGISLEESGEDTRFSMGALDTRAGASPARTLHEADTSFVQGTGDPRGRPGSGPGDFDQIIRHSERLIEQQTALEDARKQVTLAFQELQTAQARLRRIEAFFSSLFLSATMTGSEGAGEGAMPASSLVARILREAGHSTGRAYQFETTIPALLLEDATRWDELEMDRFSETNLLVYALNESIGDIATATAQLQRALAHLDALMGQHITTAQQLHAGVTRHFPQATRLARGLLVRAWEQQVIIPFTQVLRIDYQRQDDYHHFYTLNSLLGFPSAAAPDSPKTPTTAQIQPVLRLGMDVGTPAAKQIGVQVDEVIGQVELLARQPPAPLQRPGISGMAIDSAGNVLLILDLPKLVWREQSRQDQKHVVSEQRETYQIAQHTTRARPKILIVDDSVTIRRTLRQTL
ncbi:MAG TPA: Hpt domain-containing protein, partial [Ktedonobacteraceae bacterium]